MGIIVKTNGFPTMSRENFLTPFDKMFDNMFHENYPEMVERVGVSPFEGSAYPKVNVYEYDDRVSVIAEIPGINKDNLEINIEDGILTVKGNKHGFVEDDDATIVRRELKHSAFERKFTLGDSLDVDEVKARFKDGLLTITIEKIEEVKPKKSFVKIK